MIAMQSLVRVNSNLGIKMFLAFAILIIIKSIINYYKKAIRCYQDFGTLAPLRQDVPPRH